MKKIVWLAILLCMISVTVSAFADTAAPVTTQTATATVTNPEAKKGWGTRSAEKLGRGFTNLFFSLVEIPYHVTKEFERTDPVGAVPSGLLKGVSSAIGRACAGVFDVATFFLPSKPIISDFDAGWWTA